MAIIAANNQSQDQVQNDSRPWVHETGNRGGRTGRANWHHRDDSHVDTESHYTPSSASGSQDPQSNPGTYQVSQFQFFSAAAFLLLGQAQSLATNSTTGASATPASGTTAASGSATTAAAQTQPATTTGASPASSSTTAQAPVSSTDSATAPSTTGSSAPTSTTDPLQALNNALQSLGLTQQQIQAFDQVASFINSVSPGAFSDLVNQLQSLAQEVSQGAAAVGSDPASASAAASTSAPASAGPALAPASAAVVPASTSAATPASASTAAPSTAPASTAPSGTYQIEELVIRFSAVDVQGTTGTPNTTSGSSSTSGTPFNLSEFNLNIKEVNLTLSDGNGQTAQITAPQPSATGGSATSQPAATSAATAS